MLALGVWGLLWMAGFFASTKVFRHLIDVTRIRIRQGTRADIRIPWDAIESVNAQRDSVATSRFRRSSARTSPSWLCQC